MIYVKTSMCNWVMNFNANDDEPLWKIKGDYNIHDGQTVGAAESIMGSLGEDVIFCSLLRLYCKSLTYVSLFKKKCSRQYI